MDEWVDSNQAIREGFGVIWGRVGNGVNQTHRAYSYLLAQESYVAQGTTWGAAD